MDTTELVALPLEQRLLAMEALWDSLCRDTTHAPVIPGWHQEVLQKRVAALDAGVEPTSPWDEAKERIRQSARQSVNTQQ